MPEIGNKSLFLINYKLIEIDNIHYTKIEKLQWGYGHLCFYAHNINIGTYDEWTSLIVVRNYLKDFLQKRNYRFVDEDLYNEPSEMIFYSLYEQFFSGTQSKNDKYINKYNVKNFSTVRDNFHLDDIGEDSFRDKFGIILLNSKKQKKQKLIWKNFKTDELFCIQYEEFLVDDILNLFYNNLNNVFSIGWCPHHSCSED